ncbi:TIGR03862 family flavoprotein [Petrachloros mirabilis]
MKIVIIGGGPAGLMAAETAATGEAEVEVYDAMPSIGRKFLLAGRGGLNLTHSEPREAFLTRYGVRRDKIEPLLDAFGPSDLRAWAKALGIETFIGTSGRVFPKDFKAAPLLRAWIRRLRKSGVRVHIRHRWRGWDDQGALVFLTPSGTKSVRADATVLALGGASWPKFGSTAEWVPILRQRGIAIAPLRPANCGFDVNWSEYVRRRFAGHPVKSVAVLVAEPGGNSIRRRGEFVITKTGLEGGVIYTVASYLRDQIEREGTAVVRVDLAPDRDREPLTLELSQPRGKRTIASHLQRRAGITGVKAALLHEIVPREDFSDPVRLSAWIKALPVKLVATRPLEEAISTAGGVLFEVLDERLMIRELPGVFCAGEMLDWEAPTGGYLLTVSFSSGRAAGAGAVQWLEHRS